MKYIAIDTSGKNLTLICENDGKTEIYFDENCGVDHSKQIMLKLEETLKKADLKLEDVDFIACVVGAGSFTGIRIGVSTVKALCFALNKPVLKITSFDTLAYNKKAGRNLAVIDAKHNGYYVCGYDGHKVVLEPCYIDGDGLKELIKEYDVLSCENIDGVFSSVVSLSDGLKKAVEENADKATFDLESLTPLYCRKSQAEEGRP